MLAKALFAMTTIALAVASASTSYNLKLFAPGVLHGTQIKAGEYRLELKENTAVLRQGKTLVEVPVHVETTEAKAHSNQVKYVDGQIQEIRLGGTKTRLVF